MAHKETHTISVGVGPGNSQGQGQTRRWRGVMTNSANLVVMIGRPGNQRPHEIRGRGQGRS